MFMFRESSGIGSAERGMSLVWVAPGFSPEVTKRYLHPVLDVPKVACLGTAVQEGLEEPCLRFGGSAEEPGEAEQGSLTSPTVGLYGRRLWPLCVGFLFPHGVASRHLRLHPSWNEMPFTRTTQTPKKFS